MASAVAAEADLGQLERRQPARQRIHPIANASSHLLPLVRSFGNPQRRSGALSRAVTDSNGDGTRPGKVSKAYGWG